MSVHMLAIICAVIAMVATPIYVALGALGVKRLGGLSAALDRPVRRPRREDRAGGASRSC